MNGSGGEILVELGEGEIVALKVPGVMEGGSVDVGKEGMAVMILGGEVDVGVYAGCMSGKDNLPQEIIPKMMNITIK